MKHGQRFCVYLTFAKQILHSVSYFISAGYFTRHRRISLKKALAKASAFFGGDGRDRTDDLHTASVALSQLSYAPIYAIFLAATVPRFCVGYYSISFFVSQAFFRKFFALFSLVHFA